MIPDNDTSMFSRIGGAEIVAKLFGELREQDVPVVLHLHRQEYGFMVDEVLPGQTPLLRLVPLTSSAEQISLRTAVQVRLQFFRRQVLYACRTTVNRCIRDRDGLALVVRLPTEIYMQQRRNEYRVEINPADNVQFYIGSDSYRVKNLSANGVALIVPAKQDWCNEQQLQNCRLILALKAYQVTAEIRHLQLCGNGAMMVGLLLHYEQRYAIDLVYRFVMRKQLENRHWSDDNC